jgi:hypothetical protein
VAPPANALPCQLIAAELRLIDPVEGFEACAVGCVSKAAETAAKKHRTTASTP